MKIEKRDKLGYNGYIYKVISVGYDLTGLHKMVCLAEKGCGSVYTIVSEEEIEEKFVFIKGGWFR